MRAFLEPAGKELRHIRLLPKARVKLLWVRKVQRRGHLEWRAETVVAGYAFCVPMWARQCVRASLVDVGTHDPAQLLVKVEDIVSQKVRIAVLTSDDGELIIEHMTGEQHGRQVDT